MCDSGHGKSAPQGGGSEGIVKGRICIVTTPHPSA
jgi:hypothetical protein